MRKVVSRSENLKETHLSRVEEERGKEREGKRERERCVSVRLEGLNRDY